MRSDWLNGAALLLALFLSAWGSLRQASESSHGQTLVLTEVLESRLQEGRLLDARGVEVEVGPYERIVSLNTIADHLLLDLVEPDRLVGITRYTKSGHADSWRFGDRVTVGRSEDLEEVLGLQPDLVVVSAFSDEAYMARLRERGIAVFDLGDMRGVDSTLEDIRLLGVLLELEERAETLIRSFRRELEALEKRGEARGRPWGLYLNIVADSFFGGTRSSSYADMLHYGGVQDLAEAHGYVEWPRYNPEQILEMNPDLLVTQSGMGEVICAHSTLARLAACSDSGTILELRGDYQLDPGRGLVRAASQIQSMLDSMASSSPSP